ncbi:hypothetical protein N6H14_06820 [Paenibacillus sp. CC-CFT747]|nr:hypothetical protein N6H14_06820 [Paenibacillus sp. CC-CFT747]
MEDNLYRFILLLALAGTILGLISGIAAAWLPYLRSAKSVRRAASLLLLLAGLGLATGLLTDAAYVGIGIRSSWWAVEGMVVTVLPFLLAAQLGVARLTIPRLARLKRLPEEEAVRPDVLADPRLAVPLLAGAAGSGLHLVRQLFAQPVLPGLTEIILSQALALLLAGIPLVMARRRHRLVLAGRGRRKAWQRLLKHTGFVAAGAAVVMAVFVVYVVAGSSASKLPEAYDMMNHDGLDEGEAPRRSWPQGESMLDTEPRMAAPGWKSPSSRGTSPLRRMSASS